MADLCLEGKHAVAGDCTRERTRTLHRRLPPGPVPDGRAVCALQREPEVAREMGHGGESMVRRVYGHLGQVRHRANVVEYRVEQHAAKLGERLGALRAVEFGTTIGTTGLDSQPDRVSDGAVTPRA